jgi:DNA-binding NarL/FixJ family response regulator
MVITGRQRPTRRQLEVLRASIAAGSIASAAYEPGITESTARQYLSGLYRLISCQNVAQAAYLLGTGELASSHRRVTDAASRCGAPATR